VLEREYLHLSLVFRTDSLSLHLSLARAHTLTHSHTLSHSHTLLPFLSLSRRLPPAPSPAWVSSNRPTNGPARPGPAQPSAHWPGPRRPSTRPGPARYSPARPAKNRPCSARHLPGRAVTRPEPLQVGGAGLRPGRARRRRRRRRLLAGPAGMRSPRAPGLRFWPAAGPGLNGGVA
jgi:hypothetical protein